ncbi:MAG: hypothetical protein MJE77_20620 [Proteobacteria bacterium]|nr:hypothetical protein [Pseudomonadota bacterium]
MNTKLSTEPVSTRPKPHAPARAAPNRLADRATRLFILALVLLHALIAGGCLFDGDGDGDGDGPDGGDPGSITLRGPCQLDQRLGAFTVAAHDSFSAIDGKVANGVVPITILETLHTAGQCRLLRRNNPFCDPACESGTTCDFSGRCIPFPQRQNVGVVTITGLKEPVEMRPLEPGNDYVETKLAHPAFDDGALIRLTSTAGSYGKLAMHGIGGGVLAMAGDRWPLERGRDLAVAWSAPTAGARTRAFLELTIDQHGNSPVALHCDFDDTGSGTVSADVIDRLFDAGVSGFPNGSLTRRTVDSMAVDDGCVELVVSRPRSHQVRVAGHTPCTDNTSCPQGQTCDLDMQTCR